MKELQRTLTSGLEPGGSSEVELLPIPLELAKPFLQTLGRGLVRDGDCSVVDGALGLLSALNFLNGAGWAEHPIFPNTEVSLGPGHGKVLRHVWCCIYRFFERGSVPFSLEEFIGSLKDRSPDYSGGTVSVRRRLEAAKVIPA